MLKAITLSICAAFLLRATSHAENTAFGATPTPDFESLRIKGLAIAGQLAHTGTFNNRSIYYTHSAWHSRGHRARVHRSSHAGDL
jgi:hypothetical protein